MIAVYSQFNTALGLFAQWNAVSAVSHQGRWAGQQVEGHRRAGPELSARGARQGRYIEACASLGRAAGAAAAGSRRATPPERNLARHAARYLRRCHLPRPDLCTPATNV